MFQLGPNGFPAKLLLNVCLRSMVRLSVYLCHLCHLWVCISRIAVLFHRLLPRNFISPTVLLEISMVWKCSLWTSSTPMLSALYGAWGCNTLMWMWSQAADFPSKSKKWRFGNTGGQFLANNWPRFEVALSIMQYLNELRAKYLQTKPCNTL